MQRLRHVNSEAVTLPSKRLLIRPSPFEDESLWGYLLRLSQANGLSGLKSVWRLFLHLGDGDIPQGFRAATSLSITNFVDRIGPLPSYWKTTGSLMGLASHDFNHHHLRWCPHCWGSARYHRAQWTLKLACVCSIHRVWLISDCPQCGRTQKLMRTQLDQCLCGAYLNSATPVPVPANVMVLHELLESAVFEQPSNFAGAKLNGKAWQRLIRYLGQYQNASQPPRPGQIVDLHQLNVAAKCVAQAATLLADWPINFHTFLATVLQGQPNSPSLRQTFGRLYKVIYADLSDDCFHFLRTAFESFIHESWWGLICRRNRSMDKGTIHTHPRLPLHEVAEQSGVGAQLIGHLVQSSLIPAHEGLFPSGRKTRSVHRDLVPVIHRLVNTSLSLVDAAHFLAIPRIRVRELIESKVLIPLMDRQQIKTAQWMIPISQLERFAHLVGEVSLASKTVPFCQVLKNWHLHDGEFSAICLGLLEGQMLLANCSAETPFGNKLLNVPILRAWLEKRRLDYEEYFSVDQVAKQLGLKQEVAYQLVRSGLIQRVQDPTSSCKISRTEIDYFKRHYISLAQLARERGTSSRFLLSQIVAVPVSGPEIDGNRQYFYRSDDIR